MPIAAYTLDDGFDESKIRILDPSSLLQEQSHRLRDTERMQLDVETNPFPPVNSRKRRIAIEDDSQRLKKKARTDDPDFAETNTHGQAQPQPYVDPSGQPPKPVVPNTKEIASNRISFLLKSIHSGKVSDARKVFESCLVYRKTPPTLKDPKNVAYSPLNPHNLFWNDLLAKCCARDGATSLNLSVEDLLRAPETKAVIFDVNKTHLGRRFINMDYT
ncbi:hypothetical protein GALMADRAFT_241410 [Galerina marginata CBS 339.88]|uniref:Uncharacterized protein n=1 Tax=Galerina marginata (strain CBS 339.88) TaxID=685588 RepID=A0A067TEX9_GALM3|nr:hypothetical protein GALMADRAFT_241410 [Galerina marginata CBS 339.88]